MLRAESRDLAANVTEPEAESFPLLMASCTPMTKIHIPTPLRQYAEKQPAVEVKAGTVGEALSGLVTRHPELRRHLYTDDGKLRAFVNVYLNDEDVRYLQKEATAVKDGDTISIVPSIAGGCGENELPNCRITEVAPAHACCCCCLSCR